MPSSTACSTPSSLRNSLARSVAMFVPDKKLEVLMEFHGLPLIEQKTLDEWGTVS
jgi:hypothetical protein